MLLRWIRRARFAVTALSLSAFTALGVMHAGAVQAQSVTLRVGDQNYYNVRASMEASGALEGATYQVE